MERAAHRKSRSASGIDGIQQNPKNKSVSRPSLDSRAYIDGSARDSMFILEFGQSSSKRTSETPRKKLLDQELPKEVNPKRRAPSVIAKLMGLEGLPSPRHVHIQQKRLSESHQPKTFSIKTPKASVVEHQEFKDVYEDMEASHFYRRRSSSRWSADSMLTKYEMAQIQQKLAEARRVSTHKKVQQLKVSDETIGVVNSSEAVLLKHLHDQQAHPFNSLCSTLDPSDYAKYDSHAKTWKSGNVKREDGLLLDPHNRHRSIYKSSKFQLEEKHENKRLPTRIVVLKPNVGMILSKPLSSPNNSCDHLPNFSNAKKCNIIGAETDADPSKYSYASGLTKFLSEEVRKNPLKITRRMKDGFDNDKIALMSSTVRGYAGDESSFDAFESDSDSESEMFKLHSRNSFESNYKYPSYYFVESLADREAKHRLSERWKMSHRYQEAQDVCKESTLGDMLAKRVKETKSKCLNGKMSCGGARNALDGSRNNISMWDDQAGISRNYRNDKKNKVSCTSKFHPPLIGGRSPRNLDFEAWHEGSNPLRSNSTSHRSRILKENRSQGEGVLSKYSNSRSKKLISCHGRKNNHLDYSSEANFEITLEEKIENKLPEQQKLYQIDFSDDTSAITESNILKAAESGNVILPLNSSQEFPEQALKVVDENLASINEKDSISEELPKEPPEEGSPSLQFLGADPDSSESSKETDHLSPVSVLEVPFTEDAASGSESFARVVAGLRELRMQLKLLKMESGTYMEEEAAPQSPSGSEGNDALSAHNWEASYVFDALIDSGFEECGLDSFQAWHDPECPLDPELFNSLEKKYCRESTPTVSKSERKMLFDKITSAILEISQQHADTRPWAMPKMVGLDSNSKKENLRNVFEKLVWQDFSNGEEIFEQELDRETHWLNAKTEVDHIAIEIEEILVDDMIREAICN